MSNVAAATAAAATAAAATAAAAAVAAAAATVTASELAAVTNALLAPAAADSQSPSAQPLAALVASLWRAAPTDAGTHSSPAAARGLRCDRAAPEAMSRAEAARLLGMTGLAGATASELARRYHPRLAAGGDEADPSQPPGAPAEGAPAVRVTLAAHGGLGLAVVTVSEALPLAAAGTTSAWRLTAAGGCRMTARGGAQAPSAPVELSLELDALDAARTVPLDVRSESPARAQQLPGARAPAARADSVLCARLLGLSVTATPTMSPAGGASQPLLLFSSDDAAALTAPLALSAPAGTTSLTLTRRLAVTLLNDGHMLAFALPLAPAQPLQRAAGSQSANGGSSWFGASSSTVGQAGAAPALADAPPPSPPRVLIIMNVLLGADGGGCASGGLADVTSPTHCVARVVAGDAAGGASPAEPGWTRLAFSPPAAGGPGGSPPFLLAMLEPANVACRWEGLRGSRQVGGATLPPGLAALALAAAAGGDAAAPAPASPAAPLLPRAAVPRHIAIVMDGNGRWATGRGLPRSAGHTAGVDAIHRVIRACRRLGVGVLTLYAFSAQNWCRPPGEVAALMSLLGAFVGTDCEELVANGVRLRVTGDVARLPAGARAGLAKLVAASARNGARGGLTLVLALSYGGREEICAAAAAAARAVAAGALPASALADPASLRCFLPHPDLPDPDLLLRTSGELRVSNFLLWGIAYTELHCTPALWPDFGDGELLEGVREFARRERRFGKTSAQLDAEAAAAAAAAAAAGAAGGGDGGASAAAAAAAAGAGSAAPAVATLAGRPLSRDALRRLRIAAGAANSYGLSAEDTPQAGDAAGAAWQLAGAAVRAVGGAGVGGGGAKLLQCGGGDPTPAAAAWPSWSWLSAALWGARGQGAASLPPPPPPRLSLAPECDDSDPQPAAPSVPASPTSATQQHRESAAAAASRLGRDGGEAAARRRPIAPRAPASSATTAAAAAAVVAARSRAAPLHAPAPAHAPPSSPHLAVVSAASLLLGALCALLLALVLSPAHAPGALLGYSGQRTQVGAGGGGGGGACGVGGLHGAALGSCEVGLGLLAGCAGGDGAAGGGAAASQQLPQLCGGAHAASPSQQQLLVTPPGVGGGAAGGGGGTAGAAAAAASAATSSSSSSGGSGVAGGSGGASTVSASGGAAPGRAPAVLVGPAAAGGGGGGGAHAWPAPAGPAVQLSVPHRRDQPGGSAGGGGAG